MTSLSNNEGTVLNPLDMIAQFKPSDDEKDKKLYKWIVDKRDFISASSSEG